MKQLRFIMLLSLAATAPCFAWADDDPTCVPRAEVCDGRDNDCDGEIDENNPYLCPRTGERCVLAHCLTPCDVNDRCPVGYVCHRDYYGVEGMCLPACGGAECNPNERCDEAQGRCVARDVLCEGVSCAPGEYCDAIDGKCYPECRDAWMGYTRALAGCPENYVCRAGVCEHVCAVTVCPEGTTCDAYGDCVRCSEPWQCPERSCRMAGCTAGQLCNMDTGRCEERWCSDDAACPHNTLCRFNRCTLRCLSQPCAAGTQCGGDGRCHAPLGCNPVSGCGPRARCVAVTEFERGCVPDCPGNSADCAPVSSWCDPAIAPCPEFCNGQNCPLHCDPSCREGESCTAGVCAPDLLAWRDECGADEVLDTKYVRSRQSDGSSGPGTIVHTCIPRCHGGDCVAGSRCDQDGRCVADGQSPYNGPRFVDGGYTCHAGAAGGGLTATWAALYLLALLCTRRRR